MTILNPPQFLDGHRLPFRVEIQISAEGPFAIIIDADHGDVPFFGTGFAHMLSYVETANAECTHTSRVGTSKSRYWSIPERLDDSHPATRIFSVLGTAFECLAVGVYRHWITPEILDELRGFKLVDAAGEVPKRLVERWLDWRAAEDAELVRQGIHKAPTPVIQAFRAASRSHLTVVQ